MYEKSPHLFSFGFGADVSAATYFDSLPLEIKRAINEHAGEIHSIEDMRQFAANFTENI